MVILSIFFSSGIGNVFRITSSLIALFSNLSIAGPDSTPWVVRRSAIYRETYTSQNRIGTDESDVEAAEAQQDTANASTEKGGEADE